MTRAVLLDAMGTLVGLERPWPHLAAGLAARGAPVDEHAAERALRAEMAYYRAHHDEAVDDVALDDLRDRCAEVLRAELPAPASALPHADVRAALLGALRWHAFADVAPALRALREQGCAVVVVSNWDVSLEEVLRETGLRDLVDHVVVSAVVRAAKPDPAIFAEALRRAGAAPAAALHAGDSPELDVAGALAAGVRPVLVARDAPGADVPREVEVMPSLAGLPALAAYLGDG